MTGVAFFFVGAVLFVTAMQMLGRADAKGVSVLHAILSGLLIVIVAFTLITAKGGADYFSAFVLLLFVFTYVPVAAAFWLGLDARFLGWYCLVVAVMMIPVAARIWPGDWRLALDLLIFGALWFTFFLLMGLQKSIGKFTAYFTLLVSILAMVPGYLMIIEAW